MFCAIVMPIVTTITSYATVFMLARVKTNAKDSLNAVHAQTTNTDPYSLLNKCNNAATSINRPPRVPRGPRLPLDQRPATMPMLLPPASPLCLCRPPIRFSSPSPLRALVKDPVRLVRQWQLCARLDREIWHARQVLVRRVEIRRSVSEVDSQLVAGAARAHSPILMRKHPLNASA